MEQVKKEEKRETTECVVCNEAFPPGVLVQIGDSSLDCRHFACVACARNPAMSVCPVCRRPNHARKNLPEGETEKPNQYTFNFFSGLGMEVPHAHARSNEFGIFALKSSQVTIVPARPVNQQMADELGLAGKPLSFFNRGQVWCYPNSGHESKTPLELHDWRCDRSLGSINRLRYNSVVICKEVDGKMTPDAAHPNLPMDDDTRNGVRPMDIDEFHRYIITCPGDIEARDKAVLQIRKEILERQVEIHHLMAGSSDEERKTLDMRDFRTWRSPSPFAAIVADRDVQMAESRVQFWQAWKAGNLAFCTWDEATESWVKAASLEACKYKRLWRKEDYAEYKAVCHVYNNQANEEVRAALKRLKTHFDLVGLSSAKYDRVTLPMLKAATGWREGVFSLFSDKVLKRVLFDVFNARQAMEWCKSGKGLVTEERLDVFQRVRSGVREDRDGVKKMKVEDDQSVPPLE